MMKRTIVVALLAGTVSLALVPFMASAQNRPAAKASAYKVPRTSYGAPDLTGNWTNATLTPLERAAQYGDRLNLTPDEVAALERTNARNAELNNAPTPAGTQVTDLPYDCGGGFRGVDCGYNGAWTDPGSKIMTVNGQGRTSFITYPSNGRVPAGRGGARGGGLAALAALAARAGGAGGGGLAALSAFGRADNPETRILSERCLTTFGASAGPVMAPQLYNNTYRFAQSKDAFAILVEMVHDVRVIRIGGKHLPSNVRPWFGDSIGHWEGDTLVAETTNFPRTTNLRGSSANLKVTERFTRVGADRILYQFKVEDPTVWDEPWGGEYEFKAANGEVYEYACHEGNYALEGILAGARAEEADRAAAAAGRGAAPAAPAQ